MMRTLPFLILLLLAACSDYDLKNVGDATAGGLPALVADPAAVDRGEICGPVQQEITLANAGEADLTLLSLDLSGEGWSLADPLPSLPQVLAPGASVAIAVQGGAGSAVLAVSSDDPETPVLRIPLVAALDTPPRIAIVAPGDQEVLGTGATTLFRAEVADDQDAPADLSISWESDVDGVLSEAPPDDLGVAALAWQAADRQSGPHTITATVTDACGNSASDSLSICQNEGYIEESIDIASWNFEGTARWDSANGWVELTRALTDQAGTAFQTSATVGADNVSIAFQFYVSGGSGADGMSLTALDAERMTGFVGSTGGGIGYAGLPGWSIEIDTWYNGEHADPTAEDHISLHIDGNQSSPVLWAALPDMEDGAWHQMAVTVSGTWLTVHIDGISYIDQDVPSLRPFPAYIGFTAATGASTNQHLVDALLVEAFVCDP